MSFYVVFDHYYSGIIQSQVIDVIDALEEDTRRSFRIVAFVNARRFKEARKKYKENASRVIVLPNFGFSRWKWSIPLLGMLAFLLRPKVIIGRSVFANQLALAVKGIGLTKEVVLDARGAEYAEWSEYFFKKNDGPISNEEIKLLERDSVKKSDRLLAVSEKLKTYWQEELSVSVESKLVETIPSTLSSIFSKVDLGRYSQVRRELGVSPDEILLVFSGSNSDWHALDQVIDFCNALALSQENVKFLFLTNAPLNLTQQPALKNRLIQKWLKPAEVAEYLTACDYGLLLRNDSWTNKVASPVKLAEYLSCGNKVIVSDNIGDFPELVKEFDLGVVTPSWRPIESLKQVTLVEKERVSSFGKAYFSKKNFLASYQTAFFGR